MNMAVGRFAVAEQDLRSAIAIEPGNAAAHFQLGRCLLYIGRVDEAVIAFEQAKNLEPFQATTATWLGYALTYSTPERARGEANRAWELDSSSAVVQIVAAMSAFDDGRPDDALRVIRNSPVRSVMNRGAFAYLLGKAGFADSARATITEIEGRNASRWNDYVNLMMASLGVSDTARALDAMEKGYARNEAVATWWPLWSHAFDDIRRSPRFLALAQRVGVESTGRSARRGP
jgi:tetratricopeptide (TPR) repeat protein